MEGIDGDGFRTVASGQRFNPSARVWNILMQMAKQYAAGRGLTAGAGPAMSSQVPGMVEIKNTSGAAVDKFNVLGISGVEVNHTDNDSQFETRIIFTGDTPTTADYTGLFVITAEPIADGDIGSCFVQGVCPAQVNIVTAGDEYADVTDSDATQLTSGSSGSAQILYAPSGTGKLWCIVRLGNDPQSIPAGMYPGMVYQVTAANTGGWDWEHAHSIL